MHYLLLFVSVFVIVFIIYYIFVVARKKSLEKLKKSKSMDYFKQLYYIDPEKIDMKQFAIYFGAANAFILAIIMTFLELFDGMLVKLIVALVVMLPTIYVTYSFIGRHYMKDKNNLIKKDVKKCTKRKK